LSRMLHQHSGNRMAGRDGDILGYYVINFCDAFLDYGSEILCRRSSEAARDFER